MPGPVKTEAIVLRSLRYGEADRILHLYTPRRGRVSAIAKGVRRVRSRFGGRLEPFFRLQLDLHEGRGELLTITGAQTVEAYPRLRTDARALDAAARACDAVGRLFETDEPHPGVFNLLCRRLSLLDAGAGAGLTGGDQAGSDWIGSGWEGKSRVGGGQEGSDWAGSGQAAHDPIESKRPTHGRADALGESGGRRPAGGRADALAFRLKLMLAAGLAPALGACAGCGEREHLVGYSAAAGSVVCGSCEAASFPLAAESHRFMVDALGLPLAQAPGASEQALGQVERAISQTLEHHAHVRLMPAVGAAGR